MEETVFIPAMRKLEGRPHTRRTFIYGPDFKCQTGTNIFKTEVYCDSRSCITERSPSGGYLKNNGRGFVVGGPRKYKKRAAKRKQIASLSDSSESEGEDIQGE